MNELESATRTVVAMATNWYMYGQKHDEEQLAAAVARYLHVTGQDREKTPAELRARSEWHAD